MDQSGPSPEELEAERAAEVASSEPTSPMDAITRVPVSESVAANVLAERTTAIGDTSPSPEVGPIQNA